MPTIQRERLNIESNVFAVNSHKWTFQDPTVRSWTEERLQGNVLNICAGETKLKHTSPIHRNDVNDDRPADTHIDARELPNQLGKNVFDTVVYDPPWSIFQVNDKYEGRGQDTIKQSTQFAKSIDSMLRPGGVVLGFGYTIDMIPSSMGYDIDEVAVFTIPGPGKDFLGSVHTNRKQTLDNY